MIQHRRKQSVRQGRPTDARNDPNDGDDESAADYNRLDVTHGRAERHSDAQLVSPLPDNGRHHTEQADGGERGRRDREHREQERVEPRLRERPFHIRLERRSSGERDSRRHLGNQPANQRNGCGRRTSRANGECGGCEGEDRLGERVVHAAARLAQLAVARVRNDPDDSEALIEIASDEQPLAKRILVGPVEARGRLADDDHGLGALTIGVGECTPAQYAEPERLEVLGRHQFHVEHGVLRGVFTRLPVGAGSSSPPAGTRERNGNDR